MILKATLSFFFFLMTTLPAQASDPLTGFKEYKIRSGDLLGHIAPREHWDLIRRVNRIDERHLPTGKKILVPHNIELAKLWVPVPEKITEPKSEREVRVFLDSQFFGAYENGALLFWGPISSGKPGKTTPRREFRVSRKQIDKVSKKYDDSPMPFGICLTKNEDYWIHEQSLPGRPNSRGCVRLLKEDAKRLFYWIKKGDSVTIM